MHVYSGGGSKRNLIFAIAEELTVIVEFTIFEFYCTLHSSNRIKMSPVLLCALLALLVVVGAEEKEDAPVSDGGGGGDDDDLPELIVKTIKSPKSCPRRAARGDRLSVHYVGRLGDSIKGEKFDSSRDKGRPFDFQLGAGRVIRGYELGVPGMCRGEKRVLVVPPHLGYGDRGVPGVIPGGATLRFEVELLKISDGPALPPPPAPHINKKNQEEL